jgi:hypothetical protein
MGNLVAEGDDMLPVDILVYPGAYRFCHREHPAEVLDGTTTRSHGRECSLWGELRQNP